MEKASICEIGNVGKFNYLVIEKGRHFLKWIDKLLYDSFGHLGDVDKEEYVNNKGDIVIKNKNIYSLIDRHESYENMNVRVDIYYGKNKVFITLITTLIRRKEFLAKLRETSLFKK